MNCECTRIHSS